MLASSRGQSPEVASLLTLHKAITLYASHQVYPCVQGQATFLQGSSLDTVPQDADLYYWKADAALSKGHRPKPPLLSSLHPNTAIPQVSSHNCLNHLQAGSGLCVVESGQHDVAHVGHRFHMAAKHSL